MYFRKLADQAFALAEIKRLKNGERITFAPFVVRYDDDDTWFGAGYRIYHVNGTFITNMDNAEEVAKYVRP